MKKLSLPSLIAHRGAGLTAPENTLVAFRNGFLNGFHMFECDVRLSKDKELFLLHDNDLSRTTNTVGSASDQTWSNLSKLDAGSWHSAVFTSEPLLRLDSLMLFLAANDLSINIELKPAPGQEYETGFLCAQYIEGFCKSKNDMLVIFSSFSELALQGALDAVPFIPRALLLDAWSDEVTKILREMKYQGVVVHYPLLTPKIVQQLKTTLSFVMAYTVDETNEIEKLMVMGVDSVITGNMQAVLSTNIF